MKYICDLLVSSDREANDIAMGLLEAKPIHYIEAMLILLKSHSAPATSINKVENLVTILK